MRYSSLTHSANRSVARHAVLWALILCLLNTNRIQGEDSDSNADTLFKSAASSQDDLVVVVFSESEPATAVLIVQNKGRRAKKNIRCIVRLDSNLRRVARGDSLLLKPTNQLNKYKLVVGTLGPGESKKFKFPVFVEARNQDKALFSVQFGSDSHSTGIGVANNQAAAKQLPPVDAEWGVLTGRFVYDGDAPELRMIPIHRDRKFFGNHTFDESLLVNKENHGIANIVASLHVPRGEKLPKIHPGFNVLRPTLLQVVNGQFHPRILLLRANQQLTIVNRDDVAHSVKMDAIKNRPRNPVLGPGNVVNLRLQKAERLPIPISGSIHPWLNGKIVVNDHPYVARTDRNGRFEIRNIPPGDLQFRVWHEEGGYITEAHVGKKAQAWQKGLFSLKVTKGKNDLGDVFVEADQFK